MFAKAIVSISVLSSVVWGAHYEPRVLNDVLTEARKVKMSSGKPVVVFDLDDTLINTRERSLRVLKDFSQVIRDDFPDESKTLSKLQFRDMKYSVEDTFRNIGIENTDFLLIAQEFWTPRFFSNEYSAEDSPINGASKYLWNVSKAGAFIVYLTGRDVPRMAHGTRINLERNHFPVDRNLAHLMMKPTPEMNDLVFKKESFDKIRNLGVVVGLFENEPANINAMQAEFPSAISVFLDTSHSPKPDRPNGGIHWIKNFDMGSQGK